jgi:O-acetyl-ADP-ribose deacetylase (regulator of RNase III)
MILNLIDTNKNLVDAWRKEFAGYNNVWIMEGDIFSVLADAVVSPANSFGFMDGGIDLRISEYLGWHVQDRLQQKIEKEHHGELLIGQSIVVPTDHEVFTHCICCPTMRVPMDVSNTPNAYLAMRAVILAIRSYTEENFNTLYGQYLDPPSPIHSVNISGFCTHTGKMSPEDCAHQMFEAYYDYYVTSQPPRTQTLYEQAARHAMLIGEI